ncbi:alpha-L-fucosidase [Micromonospora sp. SL4-19]|uniref:alpha-L-fucosidase n=1 Tax=Micromonospora sp. SL4-19 TaxID=3399129 RepID=UPI003A4DEE1E
MPLQSWFSDAKLGIFVHWGSYAVNGITESWSMFQGDISPEDYLRQLDGFTAGSRSASTSPTRTGPIRTTPAFGA